MVFTFNRLSIMMNVQYISDTHLELRRDKFNLEIEKFHQEGVPTIMVLAGDIGNPFHYNYNKFIGCCSDNFDFTFVICGNHEYYSGKNKKRTMQETNTKVNDVCARYRNVSFLDMNNQVIINGVKFIGCTLWTETDMFAESVMNDYNNIYIDDDQSSSSLPCNVVKTYDSSGRLVKKHYLNGVASHHDNKRLLRAQDVHHDLHTPMREYLRDQIRDCNDCNGVVVVTHHAPSLKMLDDPTKRYYATDLEHLFQPPVKLWISGHTHSSKSIQINDIPCVSNCFGYPNQTSEYTGYNSRIYTTIE